MYTYRPCYLRIRHTRIFPLSCSCIWNNLNNNDDSNEWVANVIENVLWSMKNILPSECTLSSHPSGSGPSWSRSLLGVVDGAMWLGIILGLPVLGSIHVVALSLWSMKNTRPFGATCMPHPGGNPSPFETGIVGFGLSI